MQFLCLCEVDVEVKRMMMRMIDSSFEKLRSQRRVIDRNELLLNYKRVFLLSSDSLALATSLSARFRVFDAEKKSRGISRNKRHSRRMKRKIYFLSLFKDCMQSSNACEIDID